MEKIIPLKKNKEFLAVYRGGKSFAVPQYVFYYRKNRLKKKRLGITTGKKSGNSVMRSRCRRLIRVIYRENASLLPEGYDYVFIARLPLSTCKSGELSESFAAAVKNIFPPAKDRPSAEKGL